MPGPCRYGDLMLLAGRLAGEAEEFGRCQKVAGYKAIVAIDDGGFAIEITASLCPEHEAQVSGIPDYKRSIKLRSRPDTAASSLASES